MAIPLRIIVRPPDAYVGHVVPGDMWRAPEWDFAEDGVECWAIVMPHGSVFYTTDKDRGELWNVTGEPPEITVTPSINDPGRWHGFITNGELVDA